MLIVEELKTELSKFENKSDDFKNQYDDFKKFKEEIDNSGYIYGDNYEIPLLQRYGFF